MVAGVLYIIGLIAVLATLVIAGVNAPPLIQAFIRDMGSGGIAVFEALGNLARDLTWAATPLVSGLLLMAAGRALMLLSSIEKSLRGTA